MPPHVAGHHAPSTAVTGTTAVPRLVRGSRLRIPTTRGSGAMALPERPSLDGLEDKWSRAWDEASTYAFDRSAPRERVYAIDTPPPTVSGSLHVGHVFSYTHTDVSARYHRMRGSVVFYPMGW